MRDYLLTVVIATLCAVVLQLTSPVAPPRSGPHAVDDHATMPPPPGAAEHRPTMH